MHNYEMQEKRQLDVTLNCVRKGYVSSSSNNLPVISRERMAEIMEYSNVSRRKSYDGCELEEAI